MTSIREYINILPTVLTIAPTHKCTASCTNCCFGCNPNITQVLDYDKIVRYIDESLAAFPSIKILVLTGGECFLLGDKLIKIIEYATDKKLLTRVVTNAYWANSYENAIKRLEPIVKAGLTEINFSVGDNHLQYVPFENIVNAVKASVKNEIYTICLAVETAPDSIFNETYLENHIELYPLIKSGRIKYLNGSWMSFTDNKEAPASMLPSYFLNTKRPCLNIFRGVTINPYSQLLACCGLTVEYNEFMKLGSIDEYPIKYLYDKQFDDLLKFWIFVDGPEYIYELIMDKRGIPKKTYPHECAYCIELIRFFENRIILKELIKQELSNVIFRYQMSVLSVTNCKK